MCRASNKKFFKVIRKHRKESGLFCVLKAASKVPKDDTYGVAADDNAVAAGGGGGDDAGAGDEGDGGGSYATWGQSGGGEGADGGDLVAAAAVGKDASTAAAAAPGPESELSYMRRLYDYLMSKPEGMVTRELGRYVRGSVWVCPPYPWFL